MDVMAILALVQKGLSIVEAIYEAGKDAAPAIIALKDLITGAQNDTITDEQIAGIEALLDQMISDFNLDIA